MYMTTSLTFVLLAGSQLTHITYTYSNALGNETGYV